MAFDLQRGTNISSWLSQSKARGAERRNFFLRSDVQRIADWGFDHLRLPIDESQMWDEQGRPEPEAFELMESAINWSLEAGLKVIVDLHIIRCHGFFQSTEPELFTNPEKAEVFADLWRQLSARLKHHPLDKVAYELLNEPIAKVSADWNRVARVAHQAIRELEPERIIVLGSNKWNSVFTYDELDVPDDRNLLLTFHFYQPMLLTHHQAWWTPEGKIYSGPVQYPGTPIAPANLPQLDLSKAGRLTPAEIAALNLPYDRAAMVRDMARPLAIARSKNLPIYCGEFGVIKLAPHEYRLAWYRDIASVFHELGIAWANWDYKAKNAEFGLIDAAGKSMGIAEVLLAADPQR